MDRTISLVMLAAAMIAVTPASAQPDGATTATQAQAAATAPVTNPRAEVPDAPKPRTVRIAGRTVALDSLPPSDDAKAAPEPAEPKRRGRR